MSAHDRVEPHALVGDDHAADIARMVEDPVTHKWWTHTDPCQVRIAEERNPGGTWQPIDEVWHAS
jgi:L-rhamnose mutarotase